MRVIIQRRRVVNVEDICAVVDDVDTTFVLVDGQMIRVAERYRKHVKDSVYYWKSLFRKSNEILRGEISTAWTSLRKSNIAEDQSNQETQNIDEHEDSPNEETTEGLPLEIEMRTVHIQTDNIQSDDFLEKVDVSSQTIEEETTEEFSESEPNPDSTEQTDNDPSNH